MTKVKMYFSHKLRSSSTVFKLLNSIVQVFTHYTISLTGRKHKPIKSNSYDLYIIFLPGQLGDLVLSLSTLYSKFEVPNNTLVITRLTNRPVAELFINHFRFLFFDSKLIRPWHRFTGFNLQQLKAKELSADNTKILVVNPYTYSPIAHMGVIKKNTDVISYPSAGAAAFSGYLLSSEVAAEHEYLAHQIMYNRIFSQLTKVKSFRHESDSLIHEKLRKYPYLLLHLDTSRSSKDIEFGLVCGFAQRALALGFSIVLTGTLHNDLRQIGMEKDVYDLRGKTTIDDLGKLVQSASYVLSADTVTAHLAKLFGVKQFIITKKFQKNFIPNGLQVCLLNEFDDLKDCL
jgi:hypothetical protein